MADYDAIASNPPHGCGSPDVGRIVIRLFVLTPQAILTALVLTNSMMPNAPSSRP